jgi:hypothetical protein
LKDVCLSPDSSGKLFAVANQFFVIVKKRLAEALFTIYKNGLQLENLQRIAGIAS